MKKKIISFALMLAMLVPCMLALVGCAHKHEYKDTATGYDASGNYCSWKVCECNAKTDKKVIVEGVSETDAVLAGDAIKENGVVSATYTAGKSFNEVVSLLNARCASGQNVSTIKTTTAGIEKTGIAISGNIKLTENIVIGYNGNTTLAINIYGSTTIDLNGYSITQRCGTDGWSMNLFNVREGATLNIIDSSANHNGVINAVCVVAQIDNGGVMNVYDGTIKAAAAMTRADVEPADDPMSIQTIRFSNGGTFNLYGGKVETVATRAVNDGGSYTHTKWNFLFASVYGKNKGTVNLYGGTIQGDIAQLDTVNEVETVILNDER